MVLFLHVWSLDHQHPQHSGACWTCRPSGPSTDLLHQNLHFNKTSSGISATLKSEKHYCRTPLDPDQAGPVSNSHSASDQLSDHGWPRDLSEPLHSWLSHDYERTPTGPAPPRCSEPSFCLSLCAHDPLPYGHSLSLHSQLSSHSPPFSCFLFSS